MTKKERIEHGLTKDEMFNFVPEQGVDISWHSDGTCTIIDSDNTGKNKDKTKKKFKKMKKKTYSLIPGLDTKEV